MYAAVYYPANASSGVVASAKLAHWLKTVLDKSRLYDGVLFVDSTTINRYELSGEPFDLYMVNVPKTMIPHIETTEQWILAARRVVYLQNDYKIWAPFPEIANTSIVYRAFNERIHGGDHPTVWSTVRNRCEQYPEHYRYVNLNAVAYQPLKVVKPQSSRLLRCLYWGAPREGREDAFRKYFKDSNNFATISTTERGKKAFNDLCGSVLAIPPIKIPEVVQDYAATLYIEDITSSKHFHSPANRFYEALSARTAVLVDWVAAGTLKEAGFTVDSLFVVSSQDEMKEKIQHSADIARLQLAWHKDPHERTLDHDTAVARRVYTLAQEVVNGTR